MKSFFTITMHVLPCCSISECYVLWRTDRLATNDKNGLEDVTACRYEASAGFQCGIFDDPSEYEKASAQPAHTGETLSHRGVATIASATPGQRKTTLEEDKS
jgi:hypothetical protein